MAQMSKIQIPFDLVPLSQVPSRPPKIDPPADPHGSKWDDLLSALRRHPDKAARVEEPAKGLRADLKSTLKTRAGNLQMPVEVRDDNIKYVYVFFTERFGRYDSLTK